MSDESRRQVAPRRILAPTDFSKASETGLAWAQQLARRHGAATHLLHVVERMPVGAGLAPLAPEAFEAFSDVGSQRLEDLAAGWRDQGLAATAHVETGRPAEEILRAVQTVGADLVVLATRGHTGLANLLLGGTAGTVVRRSPVPVLTVHPETAVPEVPPARILVPVDFSPHGLEAARHALSILGFVAGARIVLLHSWHAYLDYEIYGLGSAERALRNREERREKLKARLEALAVSLHQEGIHVEAKLVEGYPVAAILEEARVGEADLVAMGTQGTRGLERLVLGSVAERVVQRAPCPVLTARAVH
jgi:nucleotide-binding universal stress UspA family protein